MTLYSLPIAVRSRFIPWVLLPICWSAQPRSKAANFNQSVSSDWFTAGNWSTGIIPTASTDVFIGSGYTAIIASPGAVTNWLGVSSILRVQGSGTLTTSSGSNVNGGGLLQIQGGGTMNDNNSFIGNSGSGTASLAVTDTGSSFNTHTVYLGFSSGMLGKFDITAGAAATADGDFYIGYNGTGQLTVDGTGSALSNPYAFNRYMRVGALNSGSLTISGGAVVSGGASLIGAGSTARGTVLVTGNGSKWNCTNYVTVGFDNYSTGSGDLTFSLGATGSASSLSVGTGTPGNSSVTITDSGTSFTAPGYFSVGMNKVSSPGGISTLTVSNGGHLNTCTDGFNSALIGNTGGGTAIMLISNSGSLWNNPGTVSIGDSGLGFVTVQSGATATTGSVTVGPNFSSKAIVTGANSQWSAGTVILNAATSGGTALEVSNGASFGSSTTDLGTNSTGIPAALITGTNSLWNVSSLRVGSATNGLVTVNAGGRLSSSGTTSIGSGTSSTGSAAVSGVGSQWNTNILKVGDSGHGDFTVNLGASATSSSTTISASSGSIGAATLTDSGSTWNAGNLAIGVAGNGSLTVSAGAVLSTTSASFGRGLGGVLLTGTGTQWNSSGNITTDYGLSAPGSITVTDGALWSIGGGTGSLSVTAQSGSFPHQIFIGTGGLPGTISAGSIATDGKITFNFTGSLDSSVAFTSYGQLIKNGPGNLTLSGASTYSGGTTINNGTLRATTNSGALGHGPITLSGGSLVLANDTPLLFGYPSSSLYLTTDSTISVDRLTAGPGVEHTLSTLYLNNNQTLTVSSGGNITSGIGSLAFGGARFQGDSTVKVDLGAQLSLLGYGDDGVAHTVTKTGPGTLNLVSDSYLTPGARFIIKEGILQEGTVNSTARANIAVNASAGTTATYRLDDINHKILSLTFGGIGGTSTSRNQVDTGDSTLTVSGSGITYDATGHPLGATLSGALSLPSNQVINVGDSNNADSDLSISADMFGSFTKQGAGTLTLSGNNYNVTAIVASAGTIRATTSANALGVYNPTLLNVPLTLAGGSLTLANDTGLSFATPTVVEANATITSDRLTPGAGVTHFLGRLTMGAYQLMIQDGLNVLSGLSGISFSSVSATGPSVMNVGSGAKLIFGSVTDGAMAGSLTKLGSGSLVLSNAGTMSGSLTVNGGKVELSALNALGAVADININNSGTLLLSGSGAITDRIKDSAPIHLAGGTLALGGLSENLVGTLTLSLSSNIDFSGATTSHVQFESIAHSAGVLSITGWEGIGFGGTEHLLFSGLVSDFTSLFAQNEVQFNGIFGYQAVAFSPGVYEILEIATPIPEPSTWIAGSLLLGLLGYRERRALSRIFCGFQRTLDRAHAHR